MPHAGGEQRGFQVLTYHMVEPRFDLGVTRVTPGQFRKHLNALAGLGWPVVRLDAVWEDSHAPRLGLTFDDAYLSVYEHALPLLAERGWPATIFAVVGYVGKLNTWDVNLGGLKFPHADWPHLREMADLGWQIGSHGYSHRYLEYLSQDELRRELVYSKAVLEDRLGVEVTALAPPYGRISQRVLEAAVRAGYREIALLYGSARKAVRWRDGAALVARRAIYLLDAALLVHWKVTAGPLAEGVFDLAQAVVGLGSRASILVQLFQTKVWPVGRRASTAGE